MVAGQVGEAEYDGKLLMHRTCFPTSKRKENTKIRGKNKNFRSKSQFAYSNNIRFN